MGTTKFFRNIKSQSWSFPRLREYCKKYLRNNFAKHAWNDCVPLSFPLWLSGDAAEIRRRFVYSDPQHQSTRPAGRQILLWPAGWPSRSAQYFRPGDDTHLEDQQVQYRDRTRIKNTQSAFNKYPKAVAALWCILKDLIQVQTGLFEISGQCNSLNANVYAYVVLVCHCVSGSTLWKIPSSYLTCKPQITWTRCCRSSLRPSWTPAPLLSTNWDG